MKDNSGQLGLNFITHFYSKGDLMKMWGVFSYRQFEAMIGEKGKEILSWKDGKQRFNPRQVRELLELLGPPIQKEELTSGNAYNRTAISEGF